MNTMAKSAVQLTVERRLREALELLKRSAGYASAYPSIGGHKLNDEICSFREAVQAELDNATQQLPAWTRAEHHDDISGDFEGYCWIDNRTGLRHWLPNGFDPNEIEPTAKNGGPSRCRFAPQGWACIHHARHQGPCLAVKLTTQQTEEKSHG